MVGGPAINASFKEATQNDLQKLMPILLGLIVSLFTLIAAQLISTVLALVVVVFTLIPSGNLWMDRFSHHQCHRNFTPNSRGHLCR